MIKSSIKKVIFDRNGIRKMASKNSIFFEPCAETWRDGYLIPVRSRLGNKLQKEYLPSELKNQYIEKWGPNIIYDDQFLDWYCSLKKN
jgi:hypothetical protein